MSNNYEYTIKLKDLMSGTMQKIARITQASFNKVNQNYQKFRNENHKTENSVNGLRQKLEKLQNLRNGSTSIKWIRTLNGEIRKTERGIRKLENLPPRSFRERLRGIGSEIKGLVGLTGGMAIAMGAFRGIKSIFNLGVQAEQTQAKFEVLLGSAQKADDLLKQLNSYANATPYSNDGIQRNAQLLLSFGTAQEEIQPTMARLGDIAMGNQGKLDGLSLAYAQMMSTGKLMGQDLMQMINAGFNPLHVISEQTGISIGILKEKMSQGAISSEMVSEAFKIATSEGGRFYNMSEKMSQTAGGKLSTLFGKLTELGKRFGKRLSELSKPMIDFAITVTDNVPKIMEWFRNLFNWFNENIVVLGLFGSALIVLNGQFLASRIALIVFNIQTKAYVLWTKIATTVQWLWNAALSANPIGLVIAGIIALVGVIIMCWNKFEGFRGIIVGVWEVIKRFGNTIKNYVINRIKELLSGITGIGKALMHFFSGEWSKAWETGKKAAANLLGGNSKLEILNQAKDIGKAWSTGYAKGVNAEKIKLPKLVRDFQNQNKMQGGTAPAQGAKSDAFNSLLDDSSGGLDKSGNSVSNGISGITGGGKKQTHITINLEKLQDKTEIHTISVDEGVEETENKLIEMLFRVLNSTNQMQTTTG